MADKSKLEWLEDAYETPSWDFKDATPDKQKDLLAAIKGIHDDTDKLLELFPFDNDTVPVWSWYADQMIRYGQRLRAVIDEQKQRRSK